MKKLLLIIIVCISISISCSNAPQSQNITQKSNINGDFTYKEKVDSNSSQYQYDINWGNCDVDIRAVNIKGHEYIVATSYVGRAGGVSIIHSESCQSSIHKNK